MGKYLELTKERFKEKGLSLSKVEAETPSEIRTDFGTCLFNNGGFLKKSEQRRAFKSLCNALKSGAKIIIDYMNLFAIKQFIKTTERSRKDGSIFRSHKSFDFQENVEHMVFEIIKPNGEVRRREFNQMHYTPHDLSELVTGARFKIHSIYGNFETDPISFDSTKIVLIAQK